MPIYPQVLENVRVASKEGWEQNPQIRRAIDGVKAKLGTQGRIFVRASGTEPVIRVMGEHPDEALLTEAVSEVAAVIKSEQRA